MKAKVVKILPSNYEVLFENKTKKLVRAKGKIKLKQKIMLGDDVEVEDDIITSVYPRQNFLIRPECANINNFLIILASEPKPDFALVDILIANCKKQGIVPKICINKDDINKKGFVKEVKDSYGAICEIWVVSAKNGVGTNELKQSLKQTTAFAGQSGVGKTTLVNKLFGLNLREGKLSEKTNRGMHTTTQSYFHVTDSGEIVVDTPGFSYIDIAKTAITIEDLKQAYPELLLCGCKYADCKHLKDDGCNVENLIMQGKIDKNRFERYKKNATKILNNKKGEKAKK